MSIEANKALVTKFMTLFSDGRIDEAFDLLDDDMRWSMWGRGEAAGDYDKPGMKALLEQSRTWFRGPPTWMPTELTAEGERIAVEAESSAVTLGGYPHRNRYNNLFRVRDGRIVEIREMFQEGPVQKLFEVLRAEAGAATETKPV